MDIETRTGVRVIGEGPDWEVSVERFGSHPGLLAWSVGDDVGDHDPAEVIAARSRRSRQLAPGLLTYGSVSGWSRRWEVRFTPKLGPLA